MRITSWNILHGQPLVPGESGDFAAVAATLSSDVLALQEIDMKLERSGGANQASEIAAALGSSEWGFAPTVHGTPGFDWQKPSQSNLRVFTASDAPLQSHYGIAIVSKVPVKQWLRLELGKAWIGLPLLIANEKGKVAPFYVKDEPRVALAAVLDNGWTVINTHLSFVPMVNIFQLLKLSRWVKKIEKEHATKVLLVGDFNLPWGIPVRITQWVRGTAALSYPSWKPAISFDYILARSAEKELLTEVIHPQVAISDHRPISVDIN
ncbi:MAG: endonuclease/exonuclease/phosphatase family protein [Candidatus Planktophila sp.]|jgi:endonuclease/exonuclease/phosphatase family metal-dependent hydrolase|nr:endonuclease/exonuclease/phosphatase family protein [Candidatus Planktophila sp.]